MPPSDGLVAHLTAYVQGLVTLDDLVQWLAQNVQALATADAQTRDLEAQVWIRIDDVDEGIDTEDELRAWLREQSFSQVATASAASEPASQV